MTAAHSIEPTPTAQAEQALNELAQHADSWAKLPIGEKSNLLAHLVDLTDRHAARWVEVAARGKQLPQDSPWVGEEWVSGPWATIEWCRAAKETLDALIRGETPKLPKVRAGTDGSAVVQVFPANAWDAILLNGVTAEVYMQNGVTPSNLHDNMCAFYREVDPDGSVALVLGAGNITSIAILDALYRLFVMGQVVVLKMNPVNEWMGPVFADVLAPLIERGWVRLAYGGGDVGKLLCTHELVDEIHLTGSERTYDAIVFGTGDEQVDRKSRNEPFNNKPVTAELGGVGPTIVVPGGSWSKADLRHHAENIVTQKLHNSGHNCVAAQVLVLPQTWEHSDALLSEIQNVLRELKPRVSWYPGAPERRAELAARHDNVVEVPNGDAPRTLLLEIAHDEDHFAFDEEFFGVLLAVTRLPGDTPQQFWEHAVSFANERLRGTLGATITVHPRARREMGDAFEMGLQQLRYGAIGVNIWNAAAYLLPRGTWGAFPGHTPTDIQSGTGVVHNAYMFDRPLKTIVDGPFAPMPRAWLAGELHMAPKPLWFVTNKTAHLTAERVVRFAANPSVAKLPTIFAAALRG